MAISQINNNSLASGVPGYANLPAGSVLQTLQTTNSTQSTITSRTLVTTGISASITPKYATSKILVRFLVPIYNNSTNYGAAMAIYRNGSQVWTSGGINANGGYGSLSSFSGGNCGVIPIEYLDSPATTSSVTYTIYGAAFLDNPVIFNITTSTNSQTSAILMEIAA